MSWVAVSSRNWPTCVNIVDFIFVNSILKLSCWWPMSMSESVSNKIYVRFKCLLLPLLTPLSFRSFWVPSVILNL